MVAALVVVVVVGNKVRDCNDAVAASVAVVAEQ